MTNKELNKFIFDNSHKCDNCTVNDDEKINGVYNVRYNMRFKSIDEADNFFYNNHLFTIQNKDFYYELNDDPGYDYEDGYRDAVDFLITVTTDDNMEYVYKLYEDKRYFYEDDENFYVIISITDYDVISERELGVNTDTECEATATDITSNNTNRSLFDNFFGFDIDGMMNEIESEYKKLKEKFGNETKYCNVSYSIDKDGNGTFHRESNEGVVDKKFKIGDDGNIIEDDPSKTLSMPGNCGNKAICLKDLIK